MSRRAWLRILLGAWVLWWTIIPRPDWVPLDAFDTKARV